MKTGEKTNLQMIENNENSQRDCAHQLGCTTADQTSRER